MEIEVSRQDPAAAEVDALVLPCPAAEQLPRVLRALDDALEGALSDQFEAGLFAGKRDQTASLPGVGIAATRVVLVGLGPEREIDAEALRRAAGSAARQARGAKLDSLAIAIPSARRVGAEGTAQALAEGATLGAYRFDRYKTIEQGPPELSRCVLLLGDGRHAAATRKGARNGAIIGEATNVARDLSNEPGGEATPEYLARHARKLGKERKLQVKVWGPRELTRAKMGGILAVGRGSANPPRLMVLEYGSKGSGRRKRPTLALVGKGITFDTGGISIKPSAAMDEMKHDMSGGAAVLGAMQAVADLKLPLHVVGIVAAAQNMPDGEAYLPGDIVKTANGKTIEVLNTDAEGRVVLSDALHHATSFEPDAIVDLATLTGACVIALGSACCAVIGNDDKLAGRIQAAGERCHERAWPLPLWDDHKKQIAGKVGDIVNTGGREAGTITAAAFLSHFVGDTAWAHLDIAGTAWSGNDAPYHPRGATGFGVRLLVELLRAWK